MGSHFEFVLFLIIVTAVSIVWGRVNRTASSKVMTSIVRFFMKYSQADTEFIRSCLMWSIYMLAGLVAAAVLLAAYQVNLLRFLALDPKYIPVIPLVFIAENSLTGLVMQLLLLTKPAMDVFSELTSILWVRYTLLMPRIMRAIAPLGTAMVEEVFFRGAVFLILVKEFPWAGAYWSIFICTVLFICQQVLQTDTLGQGLIFFVGSTSISVVGCISMLYTGSFLPALLCHAAYAFVYLQLGTSLSRLKPKRQGPKPRSAYPSF